MLPLDSLASKMADTAQKMRLNYSTTLYSFPAATSIQEEEETSGLVWIVLFSCLIISSLITNSVFVLAVAVNTRKRTVPHIITCLFLIINLLDYALLIFEFSLGLSHQFPHSEAWCSLYQLLLQANPLHTAALILLLVYHAFPTTTTTTSSSSPTTPSSSLSCTKASVLSVVLVFPLIALVSLPTILYSGMAVYPSGARYCVMDLGGVANWAGLQPHRQQAFTALYYLIYRSVLPYFLPLCLVIIPCCRLYKRVNTAEDKLGAVSTSLATVVSYFIFYSCLAGLVFIRQSLEIGGEPLASRTKWILAVLQSLFTLLATFQHVFRPLLCLSLDIDLRLGLLAWLGRGAYTEYESVERRV